MRLQGSVAIVTGAGWGLGRAIAERFAAEGSHVVVTDIDVAHAAAVADGICTNGGSASACRLDVTVAAEIDAAVTATLDARGQVDILVNNAGGSARERCSEFRASGADVWQSVVARNLLGTFACTRALINHMIGRRRGKVINIASTAGMHAEAGQCDYGAAKAGVIQFTRSLAREVGPYGVNVNAISPGMIMGTAASAAVPADITERGLAAQFFKRADGRLGEPRDVANAALFLASEESSFMTGNNLVVSGGIGL
jgi:NAD(P)-dependent dehydrogenase (short-subunit alcohol dehydrogenase family)